MSLLTLLLEKGANPATANAVGETPVHWAAKSANIEVPRKPMAGLGNAYSQFGRVLETLLATVTLSFVSVLIFAST